MEQMIQVEKENVEQFVFVEREPMTLNIGGTTDYNGLSNKPSINGTTLSGDKSLSDLGIQSQLISGQTIKTINGQSILGEGNITIQGESGGSYTPNISNEVLEFLAGSNARVEGEELIF